MAIGYGVTGTVVRDRFATPVLTGNLGNIRVHEATADLKPAPELGAGVVFPFTPGTTAIVSMSWSPTAFRVTESSSVRDVQDVSLLQGVVSVRRQLGRVFEAGAGIGAGYMAGRDEALLRGGASFSPLVQATLGAGRNAGAHRVHVGGVVQLQRFGSEAISDADAKPANFMRYAIRASMTWKGAAQ
jgi:hypothetical protein